jgi:hypothetical protein
MVQNADLAKPVLTNDMAPRGSPLITRIQIRFQKDRNNMNLVKSISIDLLIQK